MAFSWASPWVQLVLFVGCGTLVASLDNGLASTPPMGWRSWNCYHGAITADSVKATVDAVTSRSRLVAGTPTSLSDLGYKHVGVDDGWQACQTGKDCSFHAANGTPLVNTSKFPDLRALVQYGDAKGVLIGWYQINCICCDEFTDPDNTTWKHKVYAADTKQLIDAGFHGVKLDDCGDGTGAGLLQRVAAINASGRALLIENSNQGVGGPGVKPHNGRDNPVTADAPCPFNLFRTGGDIVADFGVVIDKLQRTVPYLGNASTRPISRPGCWAYPDMLEVGNFNNNGALGHAESRTHFGAWCIVSSPLILGLDLTDSAKVDAVWDIISNQEAIKVNQQWAGQPGRLVTSAPAYQVWAKQLPQGDVAVLIFNRGAGPVDVNVSASSIAPSLTDSALARDIWNHADTPGVILGGELRVAALPSHDSVFYRFSMAHAAAPILPSAVWWPAKTAPGASVVGGLNPTSTVMCERVQGGGAGDCALLTPCEQRCAAAGHCCVGATSGYQQPSCAQGCLVGKQTKTLEACDAVCAAAAGKCSWDLPNGTQMTNCQSCPSTCCNPVVANECQQGCSFVFA